MKAAADRPRRCRLGLAGLCLLLAGACGVIRPAPTAGPPAFYTLDRAAPARRAASGPAPAEAPTLLVGGVRAVAGFDSQHIIYVRQAHRPEYFAHGEWTDTPARMLSPLIVSALRDTGIFRAVVPTPGSATGDLRLDTQVLMLQHDFTVAPSRVRFALRADVVDNATRRVVASRELGAVAPAPDEDLYGGVLAANRAVDEVLEKLAAFCGEAAAAWQAGGRGMAPP